MRNLCEPAGCRVFKAETCRRRWTDWTPARRRLCSCWTWWGSPSTAARWRAASTGWSQWYAPRCSRTNAP